MRDAVTGAVSPGTKVGAREEAAEGGGGGGDGGGGATGSISIFMKTGAIEAAAARGDGGAEAAASTFWCHLALSKTIFWKRSLRWLRWSCQRRCR